MKTTTSTTIVTIAVLSTAQSIAGRAISQAPTAAVAMQRSPWHSPVPYLFGGLAAMLGLIAFALLILACSYWRLTGREEQRRRDLESSAGKDDSLDSAEKAPKIYEEKILVIMAGDHNPTFLATPICSNFVSIAAQASKSHVDRDGSSDEKADKEVTTIHDDRVPDDVAVQEQRNQ